ncbi:hypothetical protein M911_16125 [Ectothiorhodospira haloalkaliphila]|uniref:Uncharacterized protein n=1 Tax=Ectothiorhodospira haloalkaliphila TaxID=421628 RepID=W8KKS9_9GAMM|nr:hypothetical protein M911_16125 [Ectothiorhodospira haloalkaliphila]
MTALSQQSPFLLMEATIWYFSRRCRYTRDAYWLPLSAVTHPARCRLCLRLTRARPYSSFDRLRCRAKKPSAMSSGSAPGRISSRARTASGSTWLAATSSAGR